MSPIVESLMEKNIENEMGSGMIQGVRVPGRFFWLGFEV